MIPFIARKPAAAQPGTNDRRSFLQKLGVGLSAAVGTTAVIAKPDRGKVSDLSLQVARLEAEKALRALHLRYEQAMDEGQTETVLALFAEDAEVVFNGGVFSGRAQGLTRLYRQHFATGHTGKRMQPAPGFAPAADQMYEQVDLAPDLRTAKATFPYSIQVGRPIESASSLASMARAQGEGVHTWWEGGLYELSYTKDAVQGAWKITRLVYNTLSRADYRAGRSYANPIAVAAFSACFPTDETGPDRLA